MTRGGLEGARPVGPGVLWVFRTFHRLRHNLNLSHALATLTMGSTNTVRTSITTTNHQHILAFGSNAIVLAELHASQHTVLLRQHLEGEVNTLQLSAWGLEISCCWGSSRNDYGIEIGCKRCRISNILVIFKLYSLLLQQLDAAVDDGLVELEVRDTIAQEPACGLVLLEDRNAVAHQVKVVGSSESGGSCTDDSHLLAITLDVSLGLDETLLESHLCDGALVLTIGCWLVVETVQYTGLLAQGGTDTASELWEGVSTIQ